MRAPNDVITERILMGLLVAGLAIGCWLVLVPFLSAILWAAILVYTTWPVFRWLIARLRLRDTWAAGLMVVITAVVIVLPLALVAPAGADDAQLLRKLAEDAMARGLPECAAMAGAGASDRRDDHRILEHVGGGPERDRRHAAPVFRHDR